MKKITILINGIEISVHAFNVYETELELLSYALHYLKDSGILVPALAVYDYKVEDVAE